MLNLKNLPNQQRDEKTVLFLRRHWIELLQIALYFIVLTGVPIGFLFLLNEISTQSPAGYWPQILTLLLSCYAFCVIIITMTQFTDFYLDTWIVTNERIINIEQKGLFSRIVSELHLNQVQDVTSETHGFLPTMLSYGNVYIQTAGTRERFNFKTVDNPDEVKKIITRLVEEDKRRHGDASQPTTAPLTPAT